MKTSINGTRIDTVISDADEQLLTKSLELFSPFVTLSKVGRYLRMGREEVWQHLVSQVCVMGSARHMERLQTDLGVKKDFEKAISLRTTERQKRPKNYIRNVLKKYAATRFPDRSAKSLKSLLKTNTVFDGRGVTLFRGLSHKDNPIRLRHELTQRCPIFRLKSASDFMIEVGLSHDVIALDTRVVGVLQKYFGYNMSPSQIQGSERLYNSLEEAFRQICSRHGFSLAILDRVLFRYSVVSAFELMVTHPELFRDV